ncbi:dUTP diphosphatase [Candidatus Dojkabacteria bacterium]|nr:dUTP diphosphatase [Candidatus Dojkabacteria bacterium]
MKLFRGDKEIEEIGGKVLAEADSIKLNSFDRVLISTGVKATVAPGYEIQVRPRSGLALKQGLSVLNTPGTVDEQYRGIVGVILVNLSGTQQIISKGDKVAQLVVCKVVLSDVELIDSLEDTQRGSGGFGSTGSN